MNNENIKENIKENTVHILFYLRHTVQYYNCIFLDQKSLLLLWKIDSGAEKKARGT